MKEPNSLTIFRRGGLFAAIAALCLALAPAAFAADDDEDDDDEDGGGKAAAPVNVNDIQWTTIKAEAGITVQRKDVPGSSIVMFRGMAVVDSSIVELLTALGDTASHTEWIENCIAAQVVDTPTKNVNIYYGASKAPWPFKDRDFVLYSQFLVDEKGKTITIAGRETTHNAAPPKDNRVRMNFIRTTWMFKPLKQYQGKKTWMLFQVHADPGGVIPAWAVNLVSKNIPFNSIVNLRNRVKSGKLKADIIAKYKKTYANWY